MRTRDIPPQSQARPFKFPSSRSTGPLTAVPARSCLFPEYSDFTTESALAMHQSILPKLWDEFGLPGGCNCVVLLCHSLGVMVGVATAALHARDETPMYPLGGVIASGMGNVFTLSGGPTHNYDTVDEERIHMDVGVKDTVMFRPGTVAPEMLDESERLNAAAPVAEINGFATTWMPVWKEEWAAAVKVPVMFSLVEDDPFFTATSDKMAQCVQAFTNSRRVDGSLIKGAPHYVELSHWSQGWYARCFDFAMECAASFALENPRISSK